MGACLLARTHPAGTIRPLSLVRKPYFLPLRALWPCLRKVFLHRKFMQNSGKQIPLSQLGSKQREGALEMKSPSEEGLKHQENLFRMRPVITPTPMTPNTAMVKMVKVLIS